MFQLHCGMKSGWNLTSVDNTLIHRVVFDFMCKELFGKRIPCVLYGDDNLFMAPDGVSTEKIIEAYARYGVIVKAVQKSKRLCDVDYLSKHICYDSKTNKYFPFRETVETDARMLMPEEFDPNFTGGVPDHVMAAEVCYGHLYDNFFDIECRELLLDVLKHIHKVYGRNYVKPHRALKNMKHRGFFGFTSGVLPIIPDLQKIFDLYGVPSTIQTALNSVTGGIMERAKFHKGEREPTDFAAAHIERFAADIGHKVAALSSSKQALLRRSLRHYKLPKFSAGAAGCKFLEVCKRFSLKIGTLLDVGGHPGSVAYSALMCIKDVKITTVSRMYERDKSEGQQFMEKIAGGHDRVEAIEMDFSQFNVGERKFDHGHIDVTFNDLDADVKVGGAQSALVYATRVEPMINKALHAVFYATLTLKIPCSFGSHHGSVLGSSYWHIPAIVHYFASVHSAGGGTVSDSS